MWIKHITEASNTYTSQDNHYFEGEVSEKQGAFGFLTRGFGKKGSHLTTRSQSFREKPKGHFKKGKEAARSNSFNGHSDAPEKWSKSSQPGAKFDSKENQKDVSTQPTNDKDGEDESVSSLDNIKTHQ